jgi:hypothetical protein
MQEVAPATFTVDEEISPTEMTDADVLVARVELLEAKYPRATRAGFIVFDRVCRVINLGLYMIGVVAVLRWLLF